MPDRYIVKSLDPRRIDLAFPVVQSSYPKLGLERWRDYARAMLAGGVDTAGMAMAGAAGGDPKVVTMPHAQPAGIVVAQIGQGYIHGLFTYQVANNLCHGRVLQVDVFVALSLFDPTAAAEALLAEVERVARQHRCDAIHLSLPSLPDGDIKERIQATGLHPEGVRLCKSMILATAAE